MAPNPMKPTRSAIANLLFVLRSCLMELEVNTQVHACQTRGSSEKALTGVHDHARIRAQARRGGRPLATQPHDAVPRLLAAAAALKRFPEGKELGGLVPMARLPFVDQEK